MFASQLTGFSSRSLMPEMAGSSSWFFFRSWRFQNCRAYASKLAFSINRMVARLSLLGLWNRTRDSVALRLRTWQQASGVRLTYRQVRLTASRASGSIHDHPDYAILDEA